MTGLGDWMWETKEREESSMTFRFWHRSPVDKKTETERKILEIMGLYIPAAIISDKLLSAFLKDPMGKLQILL